MNSKAPLAGHSCSYYCDRPECIRAQRDELRDRMMGECALVPRQPNEEMRLAGSLAIQEHYRRDGGWCGLLAAQEQMNITWDAMLAAGESMAKPDAPDEAQTNAAGQAPCYSEVKPSQANHLPVTSATSVPATPADTGEDQGRDEATPRVPTQPAPAAPNAPTPRTDAFAASAKRDWNTSKFPVWTHESAVVNAILGEAIDTMKNLERELAAANAARKELK